MPIHRTLKNVVKNYSYAEVKVRDATSNDPWGPSNAIMAEIAQLSHDLLAFSEIMPMIWKRLNDHGKNWRHVYKSLVLLDYLVKTGSERVVQYCAENIVAIQTLKDFQHFEDGVDHGMNVREKAKQLVTLLKDTDKLKSERLRAMDIKNRFGLTTGYALSENDIRSSSPPRTASLPTAEFRSMPMSYAIESTTRPLQASPRPAADREMESVRPSTTNEEELQLQLVLAMSKEEHEDELKKRKGDEIKLQMAIEESKKTAQQDAKRRQSFITSMPEPRQPAPSQTRDWQGNSSMADPWSTSLEPRKDPWNSGGAAARDPWDSDNLSSSVVYAEIQKIPKRYPAPGLVPGLAPWEEVAAKYSTNETAFSNPPSTQDEFVQLRTQPVESIADKKQNIEKWLYNNLSAEDSDDNLWDVNELDGAAKLDEGKQRSGKKVTPEEFLGPNAKLVDFDDLVSKPAPTTNVNPFALTINKTSTVNPFVAKAQEEEKSRRVPLNQLQSSAGPMSFSTLTSPLVPASGLTVTSYPPPTLAVVYPTQQGYNPFL